MIITPCLLPHWHPRMCLLAHSLNFPTKACTVSPQNRLTKFSGICLVSCYSLALALSPQLIASIPLQWKIKRQLSIFTHWVNFHMVLHKSPFNINAHKHDYLYAGYWGLENYNKANAVYNYQEEQYHKTHILGFCMNGDNITNWWLHTVLFCVPEIRSQATLQRWKSQEWHGGWFKLSYLHL